MDFERFGGSKLTPESARTRGMLGDRCAVPTGVHLLSGVRSIARPRELSRARSTTIERTLSLAHSLTRARSHSRTHSLAQSLTRARPKGRTEDTPESARTRAMLAGRCAATVDYESFVGTRFRGVT